MSNQRHPNWEKEFNEVFLVNDFDFSERKAQMKQFIKECVDDATSKENTAWVNHQRCASCGEEMTPHPLTETCRKCWEEN